MDYTELLAIKRERVFTLSITAAEHHCRSDGQFAYHGGMARVRVDVGGWLHTEIFFPHWQLYDGHGHPSQY